MPLCAGDSFRFTIVIETLKCNFQDGVFLNLQNSFTIVYKPQIKKKKFSLKFSNLTVLLKKKKRDH